MTTDDQAPRTFRAGERFFVDVPLDGPLPSQAYVEARAYGGSRGRRIEVTARSNGPSPVQDAVRAFGQLPQEAPPGTYRVIGLSIKWKPGSPSDWAEKLIPPDSLGAEGTFTVLEAPPQEQPPLPGPRSAPAT